MKVLLSLATAMLLSSFAQAQPWHRIVKIEFTQAPTQASVDLAKLRFNKQVAYSLTIDDGVADVYHVAYPLVRGMQVDSSFVYAGEDFGAGEYFVKPGGYNFTNGCGQKIPFKFGLSINARYVGLTDKYMYWDEIQEIYDAGWDIFNHSYNHETNPAEPVITFLNTPISYEAYIEGNADTILANIGFYPRHFVVPGNSESVLCEFGLTPECNQINKHGVVAIYNQDYSWQGPTIEVTEPIDFDFFKLDRNALPWDGQWQSVVDTVQKAINKATDQHHLWLNDYTHLVSRASAIVPGVSNLGYSYLKQLLEIIDGQYGANGSDVIWVAGLQEVYEYIYTRDRTNVAVSLDKNVLTVELFFDDLQPDQRNLNLSFLVESDVSIKNITAVGLGDFSFNKETGLVNTALIKKIPSASQPSSNSTMAIRLAPNPVQNRLTVNMVNEQLGEVRFEVFNQLGQTQIDQIQTLVPRSETMSIDVSSLSSGVYWLKVYTQDGIEVVKFVKAGAR